VSELPRLLFCCFEVVPGPNAISRRLTEYIKGLSERFQVVVLSVKTPDHPHIERYHGARLLRVPVGSGDLPSRSQAFERAVRRQLESEDYGLVHFFDPFAGYALCERRADLGYRLVYDACSFPSVDLPLENPALAANRRLIARIRRQELFCLMNADGVVVGSPLTADYVAGLGVDRSQVRVLRAPVDLELFKPEVMGKPDATPMKVLHLGRSTRGQGLELLLEAMHLALKTVDIRLTLVGPKNPEAQARLEALVAERQLTGKVEFQDPVAHDDIYKVLATADVGALTLDDVERNQQVGPPLARLGEYLAAGRPVLAADVAGARALLPAEAAVLYRPGDARSLADALVQLATDTARRVKLGAAARAAAAEWDSARVRLELVKLYADVTGARPGAVASDRPADPYEPTQLGRLPSDSGEVTQQRGHPAEESNVGTNKVKTDPAIGANDDSATDASGRSERPPIMGVPLREEPPAEERALQAGTEPGARPSSEPLVVMGSPLLPDDEDLPAPANVAGAAAGPAEASTAPPVALEPPVTNPGDDVRTDLRAPTERAMLPELAPSVPTRPEVVEPDFPSPAPAPAVFVPPLVEPTPSVRGLPDENEPSLPRLVAAKAPSARTDALQPLPAHAASQMPRTDGLPPGTVDGMTKPAASAPPAPAVTAPGAGAPPPLSSRRTTGTFPVGPGTEVAKASSTAVPGPAPANRSNSTTLPAMAAPPTRPASPIPVMPASAAPAPASSTSAMPAPSAAMADLAKPASPSSLAATAATPADAKPPRPSAIPALTAPAPAPAPSSSTAVPALPSLVAKPAAAAADDVAEIGADEIMDVEEPSDASEEILEADETIQAVDTDPSPPPSALDPWLAQLVHGYCPPESHLFDRHTPPTTMPGRDT
jgi:glycosyltransferase involved in cell wall biosynthesis